MSGEFVLFFDSAKTYLAHLLWLENHRCFNGKWFISDRLELETETSILLAIIPGLNFTFRIEFGHDLQELSRSVHVQTRRWSYYNWPAPAPARTRRCAQEPLQLPTNSPDHTNNPPAIQTRTTDPSKISFSTRPTSSPDRTCTRELNFPRRTTAGKSHASRCVNFPRTKCGGSERVGIH